MPNRSSPVSIYVTAKDRKEAMLIMKTLLTERLIACANILDAESLYIWKGKVEETSESVLLMKTERKHFKAIEKRVKELHSYECPCILQFTIEDGSKDYLQWIQESVC